MCIVQMLSSHCHCHSSISTKAAAAAAAREKAMGEISGSGGKSPILEDALDAICLVGIAFNKSLSSLRAREKQFLTIARWNEI